MVGRGSNGKTNKNITLSTCNWPHDVPMRKRSFIIPLYVCNERVRAVWKKKKKKNREHQFVGSVRRSVGCFHTLSVNVHVILTIDTALESVFVLPYKIMIIAP